MADYSQENFRSMTDARKAQVLLMSLYNIEKNGLSDDRIDEVKAYLGWLDEDSELFRMKELAKSLKATMPLRLVLNLTVPLERFISKNLKDHEFSVESNDDPAKERTIYPIFAVLDHLRSAFNVGSIFRSAECMGVEHIYLVGYTPTPLDTGVQKTAMGTDKEVSWSQHDKLDDVLFKLKTKGIPLAALETSPQAQAIDKFECPSSIALIFGNERFGIDQSTLGRVDHLLRIPMLGKKNSLNVANTFGIAVYSLSTQLVSKS